MSIDLNSIEMLSYLHDLANNPLPNIDFTYTNPNIEITTTLIKIKEDAQEIIVEEYKLNCAKKILANFILQEIQKEDSTIKNLLNYLTKEKFEEYVIHMINNPIESTGEYNFEYMTSVFEIYIEKFESRKE